MSGAIFLEADLRDAMLDKVIARKTCFQSARLVYADFSHADATGADFSMANLRGAKVHNLKDEGASYSGAMTALRRKTDAALLEAETYNPARST
jgi:uncharacterized protein YjbI with pentapeptide repeats